MNLSESVKKLSPSLTLKISGKAKALKREGKPVVDFSVGEPDFPTPEPVKAAGIKAIQDNLTGYTQNDGIPQLKTAIIKRLEQENLQYKDTEILVSTGAKMSLYLTMAAILNTGDEVIIPAPYWVSYPEQVKLAGGKPVIVKTLETNNFLLSPEQFEDAITDKTKAIILNNPSNPTGGAYSENELVDVLKVAHKHGVFVIADEIYSKIVYSDYTFVRACAAYPEIKSQTVTIDGVSKAYSMTGWRIGYAAGPESVIKAMKGIQGHLTSCPVSISQYAAEAAFSGDQTFLDSRVKEFSERRDYLVNAFSEIPGISVTVPRGAFYLFPNVSALFGKSFNGCQINTAFELCDYLLDKEYVALVPGEGFGAPDNIRLSFATSMKNIKEGVKRIQSALAQ